jgi:hypothetical protein
MHLSYDLNRQRSCDDTRSDYFGIVVWESKSNLWIYSSKGQTKINILKKLYSRELVPTIVS